MRSRTIRESARPPVTRVLLPTNDTDRAKGDTVRLADFITANTEPILAEWVAFAETCGPAGREMDIAALRDHAVDMLKVIVADLRTSQTDSEQKEKSQGNAEPAPDGIETAAEVHGAGRAESGFSVGEMVSEYRALRASVIRLWTKANGTLTGADLEDLMRFNEAIEANCELVNCSPVDFLKIYFPDSAS